MANVQRTWRFGFSLVLFIRHLVIFLWSVNPVSGKKSLGACDSAANLHLYASRSWSGLSRHNYILYDGKISLSKIDVIGDYLEFILKNNDEYKKVIESGRIMTANGDVSDFDIPQLAKENYALILTCDYADYYTSQSDVASSFYMLNEKVFPYYTKIFAGYQNAFIGRIQEIMDRCFEAGLPQIWKIFMNMNKRFEEPMESFEVLGLREVLPIFVLLICGLSLALIVLLLEFFYHDFVSKMSLQYCTRKIRERINRMGRKNRRKGALYYIMHKNMKSKRLQRGKLRVRKIRVKPINGSEV